MNHVNNYVAVSQYIVPTCLEKKLESGQLQGGIHWGKVNKVQISCFFGGLSSRYVLNDRQFTVNRLNLRGELIQFTG